MDLKKAGKAGIKIYPNPAESLLNIEVESAEFSKATINLLNNLGKVEGKLFEGKISEGKNTIGAKTNSLPPGVYYIEVVTEKDIQRIPVIIK